MQRDDLDRAIDVARDFDINDPALRRDPDTELATYALLREHLPIARSGKTNDWLFSGYEDCKYAFQHPELFSNAVQKHAVPSIPQELDPPVQRLYRRLLDPLFTPQAMARLEPDIALHANRLLDGVVGKRQVDFVADFAIPFPTIIFARLAGWPLEDLPQLIRWNLHILHGGATSVADELGITDHDATGKPSEEAIARIRQEASAGVTAYIDRMLAEKQARPGDDLFSKLLAARYEGERALTHEELRSIAFLFFLAGLDTVTATLSMVVHDFARHPERRRRFIAVMDDPDSLNLAIEELLRFHAIVPPQRFVAQECAYRGMTFRAGDHVYLNSPSANRDAAIFADAEDLVLDRHPNPHLTFSVGPHRCLGIHLARRELRIGLVELHQRIPNYALAPGPGQKPQLYTSGIRGVHSLPLMLHSGGDVH